MDRPQERRKAPRSAPRANRTTLEWWGPSERRSTSARILNISQSGALVAVDSAPPSWETVWLRIDHPAPTGWIAGSVVRSEGPGVLGLAFSEPARELFEAATLGIGFGNLWESPEDR